jgi:hypothetical protein
VVELVAAEVEPADQRTHRAGLRIERNERRLDVGQLRDLPGVLLVALHADDRAARNSLLRRSLRIESAGDELQSVASQSDHFAGAQCNAQRARARLQYDRCAHLQYVGIFRERLVVVIGTGGGREVRVRFRAPKSVPAVVFLDSPPQCSIRRLLISSTDRRIDTKSPRIDLFGVVLIDSLPHHLRDVLGVDGEFVQLPPHLESRLQRIGVFRLRDLSQVLHAAQHVLLAHLRALRICNRVVRGRRFRQAGQHGGLGQRQLFHGFAEVDLRGGRESVRALAEIDLIYVQLEDLVFGETVLDLERQQRLIELARQRLFGSEEKVARNLHRDRARALASAALCEIGVGGAQHAEIIDAGVLVEALILGSEDCVLELRRDVPDRDHGAALFAEFADQRAFGRVHPQRNLGLVIREHIERRQVRIRKQGHQQRQARADERQAADQR